MRVAAKLCNLLYTHRRKFAPTRYQLSVGLPLPLDDDLRLPPSIPGREGLDLQVWMLFQVKYLRWEVHRLIH